MTQAIQVAQSVAALALSSEQESLIRDMYGNGASETEFRVFLEVCRARRLNPLTKQIHFVSRYDSDKSRNVWSAQVSIDGLRAIAERTGKYDGQDEPEFEYEGKDRSLVLAKVKVYRKDWSRPAVGVARFSEYAQRKRDGGLTHMWATKGHIMIAKCAEALALRKAFPEDLSGLYVDEEMGDPQQAQNEQRRSVSVAHAIVGDVAPGAASQYQALSARLEELEASVAHVSEYGVALDIREHLGSKAKPSQLNKDIQAAVEGKALTGDEYKGLSRLWLRIDRQLSKKEAELRPSVEDSFRDEDEPMRQPGED